MLTDPTPATSRTMEQGQRAPVTCPKDGPLREGGCSTLDTPQHRTEDARAGPPPPPTNDRQSKGLEQETRRGTNRLERPYQRPTRGPCQGRARNGNGKGEDATTVGA